MNISPSDGTAFEGLAALTTGIITGSISLVGFGVDSFIEVTSAVALLWRLSVVADEGSREKNKRLTLRIVGACFVALFVYVAFVAISNLLQKHSPAHSVAGIAIACAALVAMPLLSRSKKRIGHQLGSGAMVADARQAGLLCLSFGNLVVWLNSECYPWVVGRSSCSLGDDSNHRQRRDWRPSGQAVLPDRV